MTKTDHLELWCMAALVCMAQAEPATAWIAAVFCMLHATRVLCLIGLMKRAGGTDAS